MAGFTSVPPPPASPEEAAVAADGWFPAVDVNDLRARIRIGDGVVTHARLVAAIEGAMLTAFRALAAWRSAMALAGHENLAAVPCAQINERSSATLIWERIITMYAAAEVADLHRDISATDQGALRAENERLTADDYRRLGHAAVADMLSIGADTPHARNRVELI